MSARIPALQEALHAHASCSSAAATVADIVQEANGSLTSRHGELEEATTAMLAAAEQIRLAIHRFRVIDQQVMGGF